MATPDIAAALASLPAPQIDIGNDGIPVATERLAPYCPAGTPASSIYLTLKGCRSAFVGCWETCVGEAACKEAAHEQLCLIKEIDAFLSLLPRNVAEQGDRMMEYSQRMMTQLKEQPGEDDAERAANYQKAQQKEWVEAQPFHKEELECMRNICQRCTEYGPPAVQTELACKLQDWFRDQGGVDQAAEMMQSNSWYKWADDRELFLGLINEVCDTTEPWNDAKSAVLLVATNCAAFSAEMQKKDVLGGRSWVSDTGNLEEVKSIVGAHISCITAQLGVVEDELKAAGDFDVLRALGGEDSPRSPGGPIRQDRDDVLGQHPDYLRLKDMFTKQPHVMQSDVAGEGNIIVSDGWYTITDEVVASFDEAFHSVCETFRELARKTARVTHEAGTLNLDFDLSQCVCLQPYLLWLLTIARKINRPFQRRVHELLGEYYEGDPERAKIKAFRRCTEKQREDYSHRDHVMPSGAHMVDMVRCLLACPTAEDVVKVFDIISKHFTVLRVKNSFALEQAEFGFRQIIVNVLFTDPDDPTLRMVCEIQINLKAYAKVKHMIHRFYSIVRTQGTHELHSLLTKQVMPF
eukprot:TRINITY_DN1204_c0_g1_i2.p1 TRINITY_DN1204_c0_g1~~TRINITY_DN1204_c0_g1_i2.p1  ORF type:complete len:603 (+),score=190.83 TRINITY_DN1204_c0_g1_i2:80-1810(+)